MMCNLLGVSRAGFYAWLERPESDRALRDRELTGSIQAIHEASRGTYGSPRVHEELRESGVHVGRKRVERLMREGGIQARRKRSFRKTTDSNHAFPVAPDLLQREFSVGGADKAWVADITYLWTAQGWLYLAVVIDLYSRRVVGWAIREDMTAELVLEALRMALSLRQPGKGLIHHSDRGSQYASGSHRALLAAWGVECSMSRKGDCWDNAVAESFFGTLKQELEGRWATKAEARLAVFEYIEVFYNRQRRHSHNGYRSPIDFEETASQLAA
jgi:transposase InsO family protein